VIDVNVHLHRWPFRRLAGDDPATLVRMLREKGVTQAWAGSFDGLLQHDLSAVNARLAADCKEHGSDFLVPFGSINPALPGWQEDLRRCHEVHAMRGIRLHANYHGYRLSDPACVQLMEAAARRKMMVQVVVAMEDERTQHPLLHVPPADIAQLPRIAGLRTVVLNAGKPARGINAHFDFAMVEGVGAVAKVASEITPQRLLFGSHFPFFYFEAAALKVKEAGLKESDARAITEENARVLLG
jgi:predicted TIM-barrel fold metal-dependent hydrolase